MWLQLMEEGTQEAVKHDYRERFTVFECYPSTILPFIRGQTQSAIDCCFYKQKAGKLCLWTLILSLRVSTAMKAYISYQISRHAFMFWGNVSSPFFVNWLLYAFILQNVQRQQRRCSDLLLQTSISWNSPYCKCPSLCGRLFETFYYKLKK